MALDESDFKKKKESLQSRTQSQLLLVLNVQLLIVYKYQLFLNFQSLSIRLLALFTFFIPGSWFMYSSEVWNSSSV